MHSIESITNHNLLNDLVFIFNYLFPIHNNDINNINEHNNNNNFNICITYFSMLSIVSNSITCNNNNIPIKLVNTMEETHFTSMLKITWSSTLRLL